MRFFFLIILSFLFSNCFAQNLVPNPGFEGHVGDTVDFWIQPSGEYCHFSCTTSKNKFPHSGTCFNGICMSNMGSNEYLNVKLLQCMEKDKVYHFQMFARKSPEKKFHYVDSIGCYFSINRPEYVHGYINESAQLKFCTGEKDSVGFEWRLYETNYMAQGNECYLTIGCFDKTPIDTVKNNHVIWIPEAKENNFGNKTSAKEQAKFREELRRKNEEDKMARDKLSKEKINQFDGKYYFDDFELYLIQTAFKILNVLFESGKDNILESSFEELNNIADELNLTINSTVVIHGHSDNVGSEEDNLILSKQRALSVMNYLIFKGISPERITYKGWGSSKPVSDNNTEVGRTKNRRVEIEFK